MGRRRRGTCIRAFYVPVVPLMLMGLGVTPGRYHQHTALNDLAPTVAEMVGVAAPSGADGRVLAEMPARPAATGRRRRRCSRRRTGLGLVGERTLTLGVRALLDGERPPLHRFVVGSRSDPGDH